MNLGETIRRCRKEKDVTQEEMAEAVGVSFQSVSKWERGETCPDIGMLPGLANYFEITVDALLGVDRAREEARLAAVYSEAHESIAAGDSGAAIALLRETLHEFPGNCALMSELALALAQGNADEAAREEAIRLCERVLAGRSSEKLRGTTRAALCLLYGSVGRHEDAARLARQLPHIWESREAIAPEMLQGREREARAAKLSAMTEALLRAGPGTAAAMRRIATGEIA